MNRSKPGSLPLHDYGLALKGAVSWLGDRYLLADPLPKRSNERKEYYFVETRRWREVRNANASKASTASARDRFAPVTTRTQGGRIS
jgi:hypothetical protein